MKGLTISLLFLCLLGLGNEVFGQTLKCTTQSYHQMRMETDPEYAKQFLIQQIKLQENLKRIEKISKSRGPGECPVDKIEIPVVIHYQSPANPTDAQKACLTELAQDHMAVFNQNFSGESCASDGGGSCIKFTIANQNHPATSGLVDGELAIMFGSNPCPAGDPCAIPAWNGYLNLVVQDADAAPDLLGIAPLGGSPTSENSVVVSSCAWGTDNIACASSIPNYVGSGNCSGNFAPYVGGITAAHETGHFFNLRHVFCIDPLVLTPSGPDNSNSSGSVTAAEAAMDMGNYESGPAGGCTTTTCDCDEVADTPPQAFAEYGGGPTCTPRSNPSNGVANFEYNNIMDYGDDACLSCFTAGQKDRVLAHCTSIAGQFLANRTGFVAPPAVAQNPIPTMSEWGLMIFGLLVLNLGVFAMLRGGLLEGN